MNKIRIQTLILIVIVVSHHDESKQINNLKKISIEIEETDSKMNQLV